MILVNFDVGPKFKELSKTLDISFLKDSTFISQASGRSMEGVFPLKLKSGEPSPIDKNHLNKVFETKTKKAKRLNDEEVELRAKNARNNVGGRKAIIQQHERNPWVAEHAKRLAKVFCMLCDQPAPFKNKSGEPYLEVHHIVWLSKGGEDTIANTVAICPNCHRKMHIQNDQKDIKKL